MKTTVARLASGSCLALLLGLLFAARAPAEQPLAEQTLAEQTDVVRLIYDTDICGDCDDVLALGMIHALETRGACQLLAVTISVDNDLAAPFVAAVNHFYGRDQIPIGVVGRGGVQEQSRFLSLAEQRDGAELRYPRASDSGASESGASGDAATKPPATELLRRTLAAQPDASVVIAQVGFSTNLARLLDSPPDALSSLSGEELVRRKVRLLSLMAGAFQPIGGNDRYQEYNIVRDVASAQRLARRWSSPMVFSGFEIGVALPYPAVSIERDFAYVKHHPLAEAYRLYMPPPHERPTWDLTSVLYAVYSDRGYFDLSSPGTAEVEADGSTRFTAAPNGRHRYLVLPSSGRGRVLEAFVQLCSQPPRP